MFAVWLLRLWFILKRTRCKESYISWCKMNSMLIWRKLIFSTRLKSSSKSYKERKSTRLMICSRSLRVKLDHSICDLYNIQIIIWKPPKRSKNYNNKNPMKNSWTKMKTIKTNYSKYSNKKVKLWESNTSTASKIQEYNFGSQLDLLFYFTRFSFYLICTIYYSRFLIEYDKIEDYYLRWNIMDIYFFIDIIFNFFIQMKKDATRKEIINDYLMFNFWLDLILAIPIWIFGAPDYFFSIQLLRYL